MILDGFQKHFKMQTISFEQLGQKFRIIMPNKPPIDVKFATRINDVTDDYIYKKIYHDLVAQLTSIINAVRSTGTNDKLRSNLIQDLENHFKDFDTLYRLDKSSPNLWVTCDINLMKWQRYSFKCTPI